jgi:gamma-glutamylcysteine synthetase
VRSTQSLVINSDESEHDASNQALSDLYEHCSYSFHNLDTNAVLEMKSLTSLRLVGSHVTLAHHKLASLS